MSPAVLTGLLGLLGLLSAMISALTGVGGGVLLLSGLLLLVPAAAVVPLHGAVQFVAGSSRVVLFARHINWALARPFLVGLIPGSAIGAGVAFVIVGLEPGLLKVLIATAILASLLPRSKPEGRASWQPHRGKIMAVTGLGCGTIGMLIGSTGPIVSQVLLTLGVTGEEHVGTKSAVQSIAHLLKLPLFGLALSFDYGAYLAPLVAMAAMALVGTWLGKRLLALVSEQRFVRLARALLALVALKIIASAVLF